MSFKTKKWKIDCIENIWAEITLVKIPIVNGEEMGSPVKVFSPEFVSLINKSYASTPDEKKTFSITFDNGSGFKISKRIM